jgi:hypothetical protein
MLIAIDLHQIVVEIAASSASPKTKTTECERLFRKDEKNKGEAEACNPPRKIVLTEEFSSCLASPNVFGWLA